MRPAALCDQRPIHCRPRPVGGRHCHPCLQYPPHPSWPGRNKDLQAQGQLTVLGPAGDRHVCLHLHLLACSTRGCDLHRRTRPLACCGPGAGERVRDGQVRPGLLAFRHSADMQPRDWWSSCPVEQPGNPMSVVVRWLPRHPSHRRHRSLRWAVACVPYSEYALRNYHLLAGLPPAVRCYLRVCLLFIRLRLYETMESSCAKQHCLPSFDRHWRY